MRTYLKPSLASIAITLLISGCALKTDRVPINYVGAGVAEKVDNASGTKVAVQTSDARPVRKIGAKKNGYGMEMAPIEVSNDLTQTVTDAVAMELAKRGFTIAPGGANVAVEIERFYNDFKIGFFAGDAVADAMFNVNVKNAAGTSLFTKTVNGQGTNNNIQISSGENAQVALQRALQDAMTNLFQDRGFLQAVVQAAAQTSNTPPAAAGGNPAANVTAAAAPVPAAVDGAVARAEKSFLFVAPVLPDTMVGQQFYLCCNLIFDSGGETTDANYLLADDDQRIKLPLGTAVTVTKAGKNYVRFVTPQGGTSTFELSLEYGPPAMTADQYFPLILRRDNPTVQLEQLPPDIALEIRQGQLALGMTRAEAAMARGFPPFHQTAGLQAPTWLYYDDGDVGQYVTFTDDRVTAIRTDKTP